MSKKNIEAIKKKIQALLAKANSSEHAAEQDAFMTKANELLEQYQLDVADLADADDPILKHVGVSGAKSGHAWRWKLYRALARLYGCRTIYVEVYLKDDEGNLIWDPKKMEYKEGYKMTAVGRESAVITTDLMYPWVCQQVREKAKELCVETGMSEQGQAKRVAAALIERIDLMRFRQNRERRNVPAVQQNALVIKHEVDTAFEAHFPNTVPMRSRDQVNLDDGSVEAANSINLDKQTGARRAAPKLEHKA